MYSINSEQVPRLYLYGTFLRKDGWGHSSVTKPHHLLVLAKEGNFTVRTESGMYEMKPDELLIIPKGVAYSLKSRETFEHIAINFDADIKKRGEAPEDSRRFLIPPFILTDETVRSDICDAINESSDDVIGECARGVSLLRALLGIARMSREGKRTSLSSRITEYMMENIGEPIDLDAVCRQFSYSKQYVIRVFKRETGKTPIAALNELKLKKSCAELIKEEHSIAEVAESCGFFDYNYFSRLFRRLYGMTPTEYRKRYSIV
ncbi:MAG: helix-turn-helix transcriptional regulator [Clostridia bacterium]|nr:helix-turn-helix transcriptional regulator [Clostridia bacterium]